MSDISFTGGSRIGWVNATWPFAKLTVSANRLTLSSLGSYDFTPSQVVSIERYGSIPLVSSGVRINHNRSDYPEKIVFWYLGSVAEVLAQIQQCGFVASGKIGTRASGFPIKWLVVIAVIAIWNVLFLLDGSFSSGAHKQPGGLAIVALLLLFGISTSVQASPRIQRLVLRDGHQVGEIKAFLVLLQIVSGIMSLVFGIFAAAHVFSLT